MCGCGVLGVLVYCVCGLGLFVFVFGVGVVVGDVFGVDCWVVFGDC